jgi:MFS family permease
MECTMILALPAFDSLPAWFLIRFVMGAVAAVLFTVSETWLNEMTVDAIRGRVMGVYNTVVSATFGLGPLVIVLSGTEGVRTFLIGASIMVLAAIPLSWARDASRVAQASLGFSVWTFARVAPLIATAVLLVSFKDSALLTLLPVYGVRSGTGEQGAALMLTVAALGSMVLQVPVGWLADRFDRLAVLIGCTVAGAAGASLLPLLIDTVWPLYLLMFFWAGLFFGVYTVALAMVGQRFRGTDLATANAAIGIWWGIGSTVGPLLAGAAMDWYDPHGLPLVLVLAASMFSLAALTAGRRGRGLVATRGPI